MRKYPTGYFLLVYLYIRKWFSGSFSVMIPGIINKSKWERNKRSWFIKSKKQYFAKCIYNWINSSYAMKTQDIERKTLYVAVVK